MPRKAAKAPEISGRTALVAVGQSFVVQSERGRTRRMGRLLDLGSIRLAGSYGLVGWLAGSYGWLVGWLAESHQVLG